jgi:hypothetical protein
MKIFCEQDKRNALWRFVIRDAKGHKFGEFGDLQTANERALALQAAAERESQK